MNEHINNSLQKSQEDIYQLNSNLNHFEIRNLIKEQFNSFIIPYIKDINPIKSEINNIYKQR